MGNSRKGISRLADVLSKRISGQSESPLVLDFGTIKKNGTLQTNTFPVNIDKSDYTVLIHCKSCENCVNCDENCKCRQGLKKGREARVLVAWVEDEPVVIGVLAE